MASGPLCTGHWPAIACPCPIWCILGSPNKCTLPQFDVLRTNLINIRAMDWKWFCGPSFDGKHFCKYTLPFRRSSNIQLLESPVPPRPSTICQKSGGDNTTRILVPFPFFKKHFRKQQKQYLEVWWKNRFENRFDNFWNTSLTFHSAIYSTDKVCFA